MQGKCIDIQDTLLRRMLSESFPTSTDEYRKNPFQDKIGNIFPRSTTLEDYPFQDKVLSMIMTRFYDYTFQDEILSK